MAAIVPNSGTTNPSAISTSAESVTLNHYLVEQLPCMLIFA